MKLNTQLYTSIVSVSLALTACADTMPSGNPDPLPGEKPEDRTLTIEGSVAPVEAFGDNLVATDALGRTLPGFEECGSRFGNRYVGLFYWLWHHDLRRDKDKGNYDITELLKKDPNFNNWEFAEYYWGEPELGYYKSDDEYVIQKHLNLFCLVGIDFLYLDFTNCVIDVNEMHLLLKVIKEMKAKGYQPPRVVPVFNADDPNNLGGIYSLDYEMNQWYTDFYLNPDYADCWFMLDNKPLVCSPRQHSTNTALNAAFTWRVMWADLPNTPENEHKWRFFNKWDVRACAFNNGMKEQCGISKALGGPIWDAHLYGGASSTHNYTPAYDERWVSEETFGHGTFFEEQWQWAKEEKAPFLCITGWNEWTAGAWPTTKDMVNVGFKFLGKPCDEGDFYFVDEFNEEFNRDIEPQNGPLSDNFFYQMASYIRQYKGMGKSEGASGSHSVKIDGDFADWREVTPVFKDFVGENKARNNHGSPYNKNYFKKAARNDISESRVAYGDGYVYFYVRTEGNLTSWKDGNWMMLYIDADRDKTTGWEGYDFAVNMEVLSDASTTLKKRTADGWETVAECSYSVNGNEMEIAVPLSALGLGATPAFYFHWIDEVKAIDDISAFFDCGESAPERRYNYNFFVEE